MHFDRALGDEQLPSNLRVRQALADEVVDLPLARGKCVRRVNECDRRDTEGLGPLFVARTSKQVCDLITRSTRGDERRKELRVRSVGRHGDVTRTPCEDVLDKSIASIDDVIAPLLERAHGGNGGTESLGLDPLVRLDGFTAKISCLIDTTDRCQGKRPRTEAPLLSGLARSTRVSRRFGRASLHRSAILEQNSHPDCICVLKTVLVVDSTRGRFGKVDSAPCIIVQPESSECNGLETVSIRENRINAQRDGLV